MKILGIIVLGLGIILGIYALLMDASVEVYDGSRVVNIGLMNTKQNLIIVAGVLSIIGTLVLIFKKSKQDDNGPINITVKRDEIVEKREPKGSTPVSKSPVELLDDLKSKGLLTDAEYEEKRKGLITQITEEERVTVLSNRINKKANPLLNLALDAKRNGLISEQEFEVKKKDIIDKCTAEVKKQEAFINQAVYEKLTPGKKERFEECLGNISDTDSIVLHHNKVKVIDPQRWEEIIKEGVADNFEIIFRLNRL